MPSLSRPQALCEGLGSKSRLRGMHAPVQGTGNIAVFSIDDTTGLPFATGQAISEHSCWLLVATCNFGPSTAGCRWCPALNHRTFAA